jgi:hypothetical protein
LIHDYFGHDIAGLARRFAAPLRSFLGSNYDQDDPAYKHQSSQKRREWDGFLGVRGGVQGTNIDNRLAACVGDALVSKRHDPKNDQSDSNERYRFHNHEDPSPFTTPKCFLNSSSLHEVDHEHHQGHDQ